MSGGLHNMDRLREEGRSWFYFAIGIAIYGWSIYGVGFDPIDLVRGLPAMGNLFARMWPPDLAYVPTILPAFLETIKIALLSTVVGGLLAIPIILLAARNINRTIWLVYTVKAFLNLVRTLPDMLLAAIFVAALGVGALPGVMALAIFSFGIIAKLTSESTEAIDPGPIEAMEAVGARKLQVIHFAVVPQILPQFVAYCLYVFEINIRVAAVLGLVGAGGIGRLLLRDMNLLRYPQALTIIIATFVLVAGLDFFSTKLRERLI